MQSAPKPFTIVVRLSYFNSRSNLHGRKAELRLPCTTGGQVKIG